MTTQVKSSYAGEFFCDEIPLFEEDIQQLGLEEVVIVNWTPGNEEDVMHVSLHVSENETNENRVQLEEMLRRWDHKISVVAG